MNNCDETISLGMHSYCQQGTIAKKFTIVHTNFMSIATLFKNLSKLPVAMKIRTSSPVSRNVYQYLYQTTVELPFKPTILKKKRYKIYARTMQRSPLDGHKT